MLSGHLVDARTLPLLPRRAFLQEIFYDDGDKLAKRAPFGIGNPLKLGFSFSAHSHTYGV